MTGTVLITRQAGDCDQLAALLAPCDIRLLPYPVLVLEDVDEPGGWSRAEAGLVGGDRPLWIVMASPRAPSRFVDQSRRRDLVELLAAPVAVVGDGTAAAARAAGLEPAVTGPGTGLGLAATLCETLTEPTILVFVCGEHRRSELPDALIDAGHVVVPVVVYRMAATSVERLPTIEDRPDAVIVTSPRSLELYLDAVGGRPLACPHWALGPTTRDAARAMGFDCAIPSEPTLQSLAEDLCRS